MDNFGCIFLFVFIQTLSINTQSQFQDDNKKHERGVFILELQIGKTYVMKEAETSSDGTRTFLEKGTKVRLSVLKGLTVPASPLNLHFCVTG